MKLLKYGAFPTTPKRQNNGEKACELLKTVAAVLSVATELTGGISENTAAKRAPTAKIGNGKSGSGGGFWASQGDGSGSSSPSHSRRACEDYILRHRQTVSRIKGR